jgi:hypothetical protein
MVTIKITIQQCLPTLKPGFNSSAYEGLAVPDQLLEIIISASVKVIKKDKTVTATNGTYQMDKDV